MKKVTLLRYYCVTFDISPSHGRENDYAKAEVAIRRVKSCSSRATAFIWTAPWAIFAWPTASRTPRCSGCAPVPTRLASLRTTATA
jgi:hypothetical protein